MNLAIEYVIRKGILQDMLKMPCSLFLNHRETKTRPLVITLQNMYGTDSEAVIVKHWRIYECKKEKILPPFDEFIVNKNELITSSKTIVPFYKMIDYYDDPFRPGEKQGADNSMNAEQAADFNAMREAQYNGCMDQFFYTKKHMAWREAWLWTCFLQSFLPRSYCDIFRRNPIEAQQGVISSTFPVIWKGWHMWKKYLHVDKIDGPAPELVFSKGYFDKIGYPKSPDYQPAPKELLTEFENMNDLLWNDSPKKKKKKPESPLWAKAESQISLV